MDIIGHFIYSQEIHNVEHAMRICTIGESSCMSPRSNWQDVWISYFRPIFPPKNSSVRLHFPSNQIQPQCSTAYLSFCSSEGNGNILFLDFTFFTEYRSHNSCTNFHPDISKRHRAVSYLISLLVCFSNSWHCKFSRFSRLWYRVAPVMPYTRLMKTFLLKKSTLQSIAMRFSMTLRNNRTIWIEPTSESPPGGSGTADCDSGADDLLGLWSED